MEGEGGVRVRSGTIVTPVKRPPLVLIFLSILLLALGTTGGAIMSMLRPQIQRYSTERIFALPEAHSLSGSREYDAEVVDGIVFTVEAGLSFFHTHAEGMGIVLLFAATVAASLVPGRRWRAVAHWLLGLAFLFPLGYLGYSALVLVYGRDLGIALAERVLLIPFGSSAVLGLGLLIGAAAFLFVNGPLRGVSGADEPATAAPEWEARWLRPPRALVLAAALLITVAEIGGASMARFRPEITAFATGRMIERPEIHGLVGAKDVDDEVLDQALVKLDGGLRLFHLHAEGMGVAIFGVALVIESVVRASRLRRVLYVLLTVGGFGFPFGYLLSSALIPFVGVGPARTASAVAVLIPFGGMTLIALWALSALLARALVAGGWRRERAAPAARSGRDSPRGDGWSEDGGGCSRRQDSPAGSSEEGAGRGVMQLPPRWVVLASLLILVLAEVGGGAMVKFKLDLDRANRGRIQERPQTHGLVGVREVDGPVIDKLLSRSDFAFRLFHLHGEGMGLVIFAGGLMIRNFLASPVLSSALYAMLGVGGTVYPFGYLAWSGLIPFLGLERSKDLAEYFVWIPFGGAALAAMGLIVLALGRDLCGARRGRGA